jgi:tetratricopeptide (TPR) repeat protein
LADAYNYLGYITTHDWDWTLAEEQFKKAIELKPNYAEAHMYYGWLLGSLARIDEASFEMKKAYELDPQSVVIAANQAFPYYWRKEYDKAIVHAKRAIDLDPGFNISYWFLGIANMLAGNLEQAIIAFQNAVNFSGGQPYYKAWLAHAHASSGNKTAGLNILDELKLLSLHRKTLSYQIALVYLGLGDHEQAMSYLEKALTEHSPYLVYLKIEPYLDPLRSDQRFQAILNKTGLGN